MYLNYYYKLSLRRAAVFACSWVLWIAGATFSVGAEDDENYFEAMFNRVVQDMSQRLDRVDQEVQVIVHGGLFNFFCDTYQMTPDEFLQQHLNGDSWDSNMIVESIRAGGDVNTIDNRGNPLIIRAVMAGDIDVLGVLIEHGVNLNARRTVDQYTALHQAIGVGANGRVHGNVDIIHRLLAAGARVDLEDNTYYADNTVNHNTPLALYLHGNLWNSDVIVDFIRAGGDVNTIDNRGNPLIVRAVMAGDTDVLGVLIEHGVNLNARRTVNQYTALHQAVRMDANGRFNANADVVRMLLEAGAYVDLRDDNGNTPLALLMINFPRPAEVEAEGDAGVERQDRAREMAALLIDRGAEVNVRNYDNNTPLHQVAEYNGNPVAARVLVDNQAELLAVNNLGLTPHRVVGVRGGGQDLRSLLRVGLIAYAQFLLERYRAMPGNVYNAACFNAPM